VLVDAASVGAVTGYTFAPVSANHTIAASFADVTPPTVTVTSPVGGETWVPGSQHAVTWSASDAAGVDSVRIELSWHGATGPWETLVSGIADTGSWDWTLPMVTSDSALIRVSAWDPSLGTASATSDSVFHVRDPNVGVGDARGHVLALAAPAPNPARDGTRLRFSLPAAGHARIEVLDLAGRRVWGAAGGFAAGTHALSWDGTREDGSRVGAGLYFVRLTSAAGVRTQRLVLMR
jgi:hypothetical protein